LVLAFGAEFTSDSASPGSGRAESSPAGGASERNALTRVRRKVPPTRPRRLTRTVRARRKEGTKYSTGERGQGKTHRIQKARVETSDRPLKARRVLESIGGSKVELSRGVSSIHLGRESTGQTAKKKASRAKRRRGSPAAARLQKKRK